MSWYYINADILRFVYIHFLLLYVARVNEVLLCTAKDKFAFFPLYLTYSHNSFPFLICMYFTNEKDQILI